MCSPACMADDNDKKDPKSGQHQTDLAEGEPDTIDESIRIHEEKKDQQGKPQQKK
jgi:hypothetical protein